MAEQTGEKTEMPTAKKLRDARNKGQVCSSKDIVSTAILIVLMVVTAIATKFLVDDFAFLMDMVADRSDALSHAGAKEAAFYTGWIVLKYSLIFAFAAAVIAVAGNVAQIGFLFTFEPIIPKMEKIHPAEGFKRICSMKNFFEFLKNCAKVTFLSYLLYKIIMASVPELVTIGYGTIGSVVPALRELMKRLACYTVFGYVVIAVVDRVFQGKNFTKQMMMTKDEVKREYKETEGSVEIKQEQRRFRDEILNGPDPAVATKKSTVVVTNPTHLSVGIRYREDEAPLPKIVVAGMDRQAKIIRETALAEGIPVYENVPLAWRLWRECEVENFIPTELVEPVAEVLKWVRRMEAARKEEAELDSVSLPGRKGVL